MSYEQRCTCGTLLCKQTHQGNFEFKIANQNVFIAFPWGMIQCKRCEKIWIVKPFKKLEQYQNEIVNLNVSYFEKSACI
jgi:hypothetical protein